MSSVTTPIDLSADFCRQRQLRLSAAMQEMGADRAVLSRPEHVQYLTGFRPHRLMQSAVCLEASGQCLLVAPNEAPQAAAADEVAVFAAQHHATLRQEQVQAVASTLQDLLADRPVGRRIAVEYSAFGPHFLSSVGAGESPALVDIEPELFRQRRKKDPDELALIGRAIECTDAMYARAREIIEPGISELEVFNQLQAAAVQAAGEPLTATGNDYQCNSPGGMPRERAVRAGELFILDLGPAYRGYYADNCRTVSVDGHPTDAQQRAWHAIVSVLEMVQQRVRPGVSCKAVFEEAQSMLDEYRTGSFAHHLGHGIGLFPHEAPHLNPHWDDVFEEGDVFTAEPGLYGPELAAGIRLEQDYRVTSDGVERLTTHPLEL